MRRSERPRFRDLETGRKFRYNGNWFRKIGPKKARNLRGNEVGILPDWRVRPIDG